MTGKLKYRRFKVSRILEGDPNLELKDTLVSEIAESMKVHGQLQPIAVRRDRKSKKRRYELLDGAHRLRAVQVINGKGIDCVVVEMNDADTRMVQIAQNLFRKHLAVLERAELLEAWLAHASARLNISGQPVQKRGRGRPSGGIAMAAKGLPVVGRSVEARRKRIERAVQIANIVPEAKKVVRQARLDNNQRVLLEIAKAPNSKAQVKKAEELAQAVQVTGSAKRASSDDNAGGRPNAPTGRSKACDDSAANRSKSRATSVAETTFLELEAFWDKHGRKLWSYATAETRKRFFEKLARAICRAQPDVLKFVQDAMRGRQMIAKSDFVALGTVKGLSKKRVLRTARSIYRSRRKGHGYNGKWYFVNPDTEWKSRMTVIREAEFELARKTLVDVEMQKPKPFDDGSSKAYYASLSDDEPNEQPDREKEENRFNDLG